MKIAVTYTGPTLDDIMEARFGRCPLFPDYRFGYHGI